VTSTVPTELVRSGRTTSSNAAALTNTRRAARSIAISGSSPSAKAASHGSRSQAGEISAAVTCRPACSSAALPV
jgi:hypothetical protein